MTGDRPSTRGRLLVALPALLDPNFERSVLFVLEHSPEGALALVLDRPTDSRVDGALPAWAAMVVEPGVIFVGGPVAAAGAIGLARSPTRRSTPGWTPLLDRWGTVDLHLDPAEVEADVEGLRVFAGHAGWGPGQLDEELAEGAWAVVDALPEDPLTVHPAHLWRTVLRRQGGRTAWLANHPGDPSVN